MARTKITKEKKKNAASIKYIFVVGGVMSGVGKGVTTASIGQILQARGYNVSAIKMDPYINVDAGTMNPIEHGEVFVTEDADETDQDIGNYERFLNKNIYRENYMTTGRVYQTVINRERNLGYKGKCVQVVPHIPQEIRDRIEGAVSKTGAEIMIIEVGGTVGEYENLLFLEAARVMKLYNPKDVLFVMVSYLPIPSIIGEMKTKPTQHAVRNLQSAGIQPDFLIARSERPVDQARKEKLSINCNIPAENVISAPDADSIYDIPLNFEKDHLSSRILEKFGLPLRRRSDNGAWRKMVAASKTKKPIINIGIVGKYFASGDFSFGDSYISVIEAIKHATATVKCKAKIHWLSAEDVEKRGTVVLKNMDGIIVPQGWGERGAEGKIKTIKYCRENKVPYFGLCYGMQMAAIEFARNVAGLKDANSAEVDPKTTNPVIHIMPGQAQLIKEKGYGGTIRLGGWPCRITPQTHLAKAYEKFTSKKTISERHRHRYEFNNIYRDKFAELGLTVAGTSPDGEIVEAIEITNHPFFIGVQFHPEYISRPLAPHPLFVEFIKVCKNLN
ncbi:CTP synthase [Candidatus Falkowbacteria bacterium]|uniref:CTP synthase n=1 Tax=Candidatus Falkowbacteria bacterium CG10_big_fil_rev_8_21_14_0_10_37_18 TaxID=1974562 RepID=A0A2H0V9E4_9BACT|nr:CTP synthase [Candidatus Falkowbacteria bacterium]NCQ12486.1 CTP synthase [Candidatus Falkowbacteria bacterium]OIO06083.1 MAG: CTP synthase [Candidatus Falkowbacteria bacterium CG1_02_37_21]PIR95681.1 MAG: CTP synthase [Candidatus Falkowbacteria bacterium CG10_big_fil_rev_8_21_14_0_10_37_18]